MTIAAGFVGGDGLVVCADSQLTGPLKRNGAKLWLIPDPPSAGATVVLAGAGDTVLIERTRDEIRRLLHPDARIDDIVQLVINQILVPIYESSIAADRSRDLDILLAIRAHSECRLYRNDNVPTLAQVDECICIGSGNALGTYLSDSLFARGMPIQFVRTVAAHMLRLTKKYVESCGGASYIAMLPSTGVPAFVNTDTIDELERQTEAIEDAVRKVLVFSPGIEGIDFNAETLAARTQALGDAVAAARGLYINVGVGTVQASGTSSTSVVAPVQRGAERVDIREDLIAEMTRPSTSGNES